MKTAYSEKKDINSDVRNKSFLNELCHQSPFLVINTPCGIDKYKFNKIGYDDNKNLVLEYVLIDDERYKDTSVIIDKLGKFYYLTATQLLYAFKHYANS